MYLSDFARFWRSEMNSLQCPPSPKEITDLPLSARMLLENFEGGKLCQDMFGNPSALPADTLFRFQNEQFVPDDIEHYERAGLTVAAETARNRAAAAGDQQLQIRAEQGRKEYLRQRKEMQAWQDLPLGHPLKQPSGEDIARTRAEWGITDQPSWEQPTSKGQD